MLTLLVQSVSVLSTPLCETAFCRYAYDAAGLSNFVAQILLAIILWGLGTKDEIDDDDSTEASEIETESFDDDADM